MSQGLISPTIHIVTSREGRVSRNMVQVLFLRNRPVTSREGRVSRNGGTYETDKEKCVTSREGRVSRNGNRNLIDNVRNRSRPARGV